MGNRVKRMERRNKRPWKKINEIKEKMKKQDEEISVIINNQWKQNKYIYECIKTFATKETTDEIKNVTIANKRNIIAVASLWLQFAKTNVHIYIL